MRVLFLSDYFYPTVGGIEVRALPFLKAMCRRGHQVRVVTGSDREGKYPAESNYDGVRVLRVPLATALESNDFREVIAIKRQVAALKRDFQPDIVHVFLAGPMAMLHLETATSDPPPFLVSTTSWVERSIDANSTLAKVFRSANWTTANSARLLSNICSVVPEIKDRGSVVYSGNPPTDSEPDSFDPNGRQILCVGRLIDKKGFEFAIRAMPTILERFPTSRLIIAGDGPSRQQLTTIAEELSLSNAIGFLGWVDPAEIAPLMGKSSVIVVPSIGDEAFASVAIQAAWAGRPCVSTNCGGMAEAVVDGQTGLLIHPGDAAAIADAVITLFGDPDRTARLGANGLLHAQSVFSWERYLDDFERLYLRLTAQRAASTPEPIAK